MAYFAVSLIGKRMDAATEMIKTPPTIDKESGEVMWKKGAIIILNPMKANIIAKPNFNRLNMWIKLANRKYKERNPRIAKIFEV